MRRFLFLVALLPGFALAASPTFTVIDLGTMPGLQWAPVPPSVGNSAGAFYGSLGGGATYIFQSTRVGGFGVAVGKSSIANPDCFNEVFHAFLFVQNTANSGTMQDLGTLGGCQSAAFSLKASHLVVGQAQRPGQISVSSAAGGVWTAFVWQNGMMQALPSLIQSLATEEPDGAGSSSANGTNSSGEIVGWTTQLLKTGQLAPRAVLWENGASDPLELQYQLGSANNTVIFTNASAINCQGNIAVTGYPLNQSSGDVHAYLLVRQGPPRACPE